MYSAVLRFWAAVFAAVGLAFFLSPTGTGAFLTALAALLGVPGVIVAPEGTLWWALSLSLMSCITVLAVGSANRPHLVTPYVALMTAKLVSTICFLGLAVTRGPAWSLCALGDGFVALTIWLARKTVPPRVVRCDFERTHAGIGPHHEEYFGMIDVAPGRAFWFRYTLLDGASRHAAVWGIFFDGARVVTQTRTWPLDDLAFANCVILPARSDVERFRGHGQVFHIEDAHLDTANAIGAAGELSWDLSWTDRGRRFSHVPGLMRHLGLARSRYHVSFLDARMRGTLRAGAETIVLEDATGMVGHIEGSRMAERWAWAHCNNFDDARGTAFDAVSAVIGAGGQQFGPLSSFVLFLDGQEYRFSGLLRIASAESKMGDSIWSFSAEANGVTLSGEARLPEVHAVVDYEDTDGSRLTCRNSRLSSLELRLVDPGSRVDRVLRTSRTAGFELVTRSTSRTRHNS